MTEEITCVEIGSFEDAVRVAKCILAPETNDYGFEASDKSTGKRRADPFDTTTSTGYDDWRAANAGATIRSNPVSLIRAAREDHFAFKALCFGAAEMLEAGDDLGPEARAWVVAYLRGKWYPPKRKSGQPSKRAEQVKIAHAVKFLVQCGMKAMRNDESSVQESACDAVAKALVDLGRSARSYKTVKNLFLKEKFSSDEFVSVSDSRILNNWATTP